MCGPLSDNMKQAQMPGRSYRDARSPKAMLPHVKSSCSQRSCQAANLKTRLGLQVGAEQDAKQDAALLPFIGHRRDRQHPNNLSYDLSPSKAEGKRGADVANANCWTD